MVLGIFTTSLALAQTNCFMQISSSLTGSVCPGTPIVLTATTAAVNVGTGINGSLTVSTGTAFTDGVRAGVLQSLGHTVGQGLAKVGRQFRRGDEITAALGHAANLLLPAAVVAQARRIQRQRHEPIEGHPTALLVQAGLDQTTHRRWCSRYTLRLFIHRLDCRSCLLRIPSATHPLF